MSAASRSSVPGSVPPRPPHLGLRAWARNSPWLMIAALLHVLLVAILSVIVFRSQRPEAKPPATAIVVARAAEELPPLVEEPRPPERDLVPALPSLDSGIVVPEELVIPDAAAGRAGESTDETDPLLDPGHFNPDPEALSELPSGATGGTPIGVGRIGHRSTGTSPFSWRVAGGGGPGGGGRGDGGGNGPGGDPDSVRTVLAALDWLAAHQSSDGSWDCDGFPVNCRKGPCSGVGSAAHDVGVTALALLAFLGAGETHVVGAYQATVREGLRWLLDTQDAEGCFGERVGTGFLYDHACATLAVAEAFGMTQSKPLREPAQRAVRFVLLSQNPYGAWRYASPPDGDNDTSVTGWMGMALKSAKMAGLTIDDQALENALAWVDEMTDPASGRTGYTDRGGFSSRLAQFAARYPPELSESMTAVGVLLRIFGGRTRERDPMIDKGAERMDAHLPLWSPDTGHVDFYYWYYGTLAMYQVGGARWDRWNEAIRSAVIDHQRLDPGECEYGSWDPIDPWSTSGGRVYATALNCLSMEVYYRYPRVFGAKRR